MTTPIDRAYELLQSQYPDEPPLYVGDTVYYTLLEYPTEPRFVVEAKITEVQFVVTHPNYVSVVSHSSGPMQSYSLWFNIDPRLPGGYELLGPKLPIEEDELGWAKWAQLDPALVLEDGVGLGNWFVWVDLPIGHALSPWAEVTPYVDELLKMVRPFKGRKRHAKAALRKFIKRGTGFIAGTHRKSVAQMGFPKYRKWGERKVYWRRK